VVATRTDTGATVTLRQGDDPVVLSGQPVEVLLFLFGRDETTGLSFDGPDEAAAAVRSANREV
jgi:hypothetical protein